MQDQTKEKIESIKTKLSTQLVMYRQSKGLTQKEMADICGVTQGRYSRIECGKFAGVTIDNLIRLNMIAGTGLKLIRLADA